MATYGFNDNLEKVKIIELTGYKSISAGDIGSITWNSTALTSAGIDTSDLANYAVLDFQVKVGSGSLWTEGRGVVVSGSGTVYPFVTIDGSQTTISASLYNEDSSTQTISVKIRLIKVALYE